MPNLNAEAHFSSSPLGVDIRRSVFDRSHNVKGTCNAGKLNLIDAIEILPGDDVSMRVSDMIRMTTPLVPLRMTVMSIFMLSLNLIALIGIIGKNLMVKIIHPLGFSR